MLDNIIEFSVKNKLIIGICTLALVIWGSYSVTQLPIDAVPDITNNQVQVITSSPSLAPQEVERLITFPVEIGMANIPNLVEIRSISRFGLSVVTIVFTDETDIYWARNQVSERLLQARTQIPKGVGEPSLAPLTSGLGEIYQYTIQPKKGYEKQFSEKYATKQGLADLRTIQDWIVRRQLLGTKGVADISSFGGYLKQYEISLNTDKTRSMGISIDEIFVALEKNNQNTGGAYIEKRPNVYFIRTEGLITSLKDIEQIVIKNTPSGIPVLISNVATVQFGSAIRYGAMTRNDIGETVGAMVLMLKGENSSAVIKNIKEKITQIQKTLPEGLEIVPFLDRTKLVDKAIGTVLTNLLEGALIVIFVLVLFLGNLRAGLVVASVIPLAMFFAISLMNFFGVSGNLMSLGAIDFGLIVDGAVIIVEATLHHILLQKYPQNLTQEDMDKEVLVSAKKIRNSAAFGEIIILIVYLPLLALTGVEGKMFRPMAQTVVFAILGAFVLSLTYVPMMSALCLSKKKLTQPHSQPPLTPPSKEGDNTNEKLPSFGRRGWGWFVSIFKGNFSDRMMSFFERIYLPIITFSLKKTKIIVLATFVAFLISLGVFSLLGGEFIPALDEGDFAVETRISTGSSLSESVDNALKAAKILKTQFPEVKEVIGKIGSSEIPVDPMPIEACDLMIILKDKSEWTSAETTTELAEKMSDALSNIIGVEFGFQQPIQMRFNELMTGVRQDVAIKIFGEDLDILAQQAAKIGKLVEKTEGAKDLYVEQVGGLPQIMVTFNREKIAQLGLSIEEANRAISTAFAGASAGIVYEGEKRFDMVIRLEKDSRQDIENVRNLFLTNSKNQQIPLSQIANVDFKIGANQIQREDAKRRITIGFNVRGRDVESIVNELKTKIDNEIKMPVGYYPTFGGQFQNLQEAKSRLMIAVPVALGLIFMLLFFTFHSMKQSIVIFTAIPLSAIGGILALFVRDMPFSISAGVGFIALFGVAVLNGIVLIGEFNYLKKEKENQRDNQNQNKNNGLDDVDSIILEGTKTRLRPVLLTALVASLGFLPMALSSGAGAEVQKPLATVVIGGLLSATLLTLVVLPCLYKLTERRKKSSKLD